MGLGKIFVIGAFALDQIGHGVEPQSVNAQVQPEAHHAQNRFEHLRIVEIQVGLVRIKPVPVIGAGDRIPRPVRSLRIEKNDPRAGIFLIGVGPDIEIAPWTSPAWRGARAETRDAGRRCD